MSRESMQRFVVLKAFEKVIKNAVKEATAEMKSELLYLNDETGADRIKVEVGSADVRVSLVTPKPKCVGYGNEFLSFMRDKSMTIENVMPQWTEKVEPTNDGRLIWKETGELVPGGYIEEQASYPKIQTLDAPAVLNAAKYAGMLDTTQLLEGEH